MTVPTAVPFRTLNNCKIHGLTDATVVTNNHPPRREPHVDENRGEIASPPAEEPAEKCHF